MKKIIIPAFCALSILGTASLGMASTFTYPYTEKRPQAEDPMSLTTRVHPDIRVEDTRLIGVL